MGDEGIAGGILNAGGGGW